jgi:hypothetical protein
MMSLYARIALGFGWASNALRFLGRAACSNGIAEAFVKTFKRYLSFVCHAKTLGRCNWRSIWLGVIDYEFRLRMSPMVVCPQFGLRAFCRWRLCRAEFRAPAASHAEHAVASRPVAAAAESLGHCISACSSRVSLSTRSSCTALALLARMNASRSKRSDSIILPRFMRPCAAQMIRAAILSPPLAARWASYPGCTTGRPMSDPTSRGYRALLMGPCERLTELFRIGVIKRQLAEILHIGGRPLRRLRPDCLKSTRRAWRRRYGALPYYYFLLAACVCRIINVHEPKISEKWRPVSNVAVLRAQHFERPAPFIKHLLIHERQLLAICIVKLRGLRGAHSKGVHGAYQLTCVEAVREIGGNGTLGFWCSNAAGDDAGDRVFAVGQINFRLVQLGINVRNK